MFRKLVDCLGCGKDQGDRGDVDDDGPPSQSVNLNGESRRGGEEEGSNLGLPTCVQGNGSPLSVPSLPDPASTSQLSQRQLESEPRNQNLWVLAKERLSPEDQRCFEPGQRKTMEKIMEEVRDTIEERYKEYKEGGLQIRGPHGKNINVQKFFQEIIKSVSQVQEIIKNTVSLDPTGHAPQAWAVISMGLTLVKNDIERRDAPMEASGFLANNLSYYATIDKIDRNRQVESDEYLEEALLKVYTAIVEYTAEVYRASREKGAARVGKSVSALVDQPLQRLKDTIELEGKNVKKWMDLGRDLDQQRLVQRVDTRVLSSHDMYILDWLSPTDQSGGEQSAIYSKAQKDRTFQTGDWFLASQEYQKWKAEPGNIMWLHGVVGCGKTVLCSTIIADILKVSECEPTKTLIYWYFNFNQDKQQVVRDMLRSVLRQLCPNPVPGSIMKLWEEHRQGREPTQTNLFVIFEQMIESHKGHIIFILERGTLLKFLNRMIGRHKQTLHILATSRPQHEIRCHLEKHTAIDIEEDISHDVERFVDDRLEQGESWTWLNENRPMKEKIRKKLLDMERPRFRWAALQIMQLERCHTPAAINNALETLPKDLSETYRRILNHMSEDDRDAARTILIWVTFSRRLLTLEFLAKLVDFIRPQDVVGVCTTYLITVSSDNFVRLAHFSVKEFLVLADISGETDWYQYSASAGHLIIANMSLSLLLKTDDNLTRDAALDHPVLIYAAEQLGSHLLELEQIGFRSLELHGSIVQLFCSSVTYLNWVRISHDYRAPVDWYLSADELEPPIYRVSKIGLIRIVESLLENGADPLATVYRAFSTEKNAIHIAAEMGHLISWNYFCKCPLSSPKTWLVLSSSALTTVARSGKGCAKYLPHSTIKHHFTTNKNIKIQSTSASLQRRRGICETAEISQSQSQQAVRETRRLFYRPALSLMCRC